jgi:hypothetical protein
VTHANTSNAVAGENGLLPPAQPVALPPTHPGQHATPARDSRSPAATSGWPLNGGRLRPPLASYRHASSPFPVPRAVVARVCECHSVDMVRAVRVVPLTDDAYSGPRSFGGSGSGRRVMGKVPSLVFDLDDLAEVSQHAAAEHVDEASLTEVKQKLLTLLDAWSEPGAAQAGPPPLRRRRRRPRHPSYSPDLPPLSCLQLLPCLWYPCHPLPVEWACH